MSQSILVVDDEPSIREFLRTILEDDGFHVLEARNGIEALDQLKQTPVDLMVLDVMMPQMDGLSVCAHVRKTAELLTLPIIMISANDHSSMEKTCLQAGANIFFAKPMPLEAFIASIYELIPAVS